MKQESKTEVFRAYNGGARVRIGCHVFDLEESRIVLAPFLNKPLSLVEESNNEKI